MNAAACSDHPACLAEVLGSLKWSAPREVNTKRGPKTVTSAEIPNEAAFNRLGELRDELYRGGYSVSQFRGVWQVSRWSDPAPEVVKAREEARALSRATDADVDVPTPPGLAFLGYQKAGIKFALDRPAVLFGDEMGLGKTMQAIGVLNASPAARRVLVICPASLKLNWARELRKWSVVELDITVVSAQERSRAKRLLRSLALDDQERKDATKDGLDVASAANRPAELIAVASNPEAGVSRERRGSAKVGEAAELAKPNHQGLARRVDANAPSAFALDEGDRALPVDDSRQIGAIRNANRADEGNGDSIPTEARPKVTPAREVVVEGVRVDAELGGERPDAPLAGVDQSDDSIENGLGKTEGARHIVVVNYDVLHLFQEETRAIAWDLLICDEAHYLKTPKARRTQMVFGRKATAKTAGLPPIGAKRRLLLTGTPIANRPVELFPLIEYLDPATWGNFFKYARRYCDAHQISIGRGRLAWDFSGASNLEELQERLRTTILVRRLKRDVLTELPPKRRQVIELPAEGELARFAEAERAAYEDREAELDQLHAAVELAKASEDPDEYKRAVENLNDGIAAFFAEMSTLRRELAEAKIPAIVEHVREAVEEGGKLVVFAHHRAVCKAIAAEFGDAAVVLVGETPTADRQAAVDRFQTDPACKVFVGSIMAAGVGITLTAASHVVFAELDWVPGNVTQAEDRLHRIGQREHVLVQHLVVDGSLDATMAKRIVEKQNIIDRALDSVRASIEGVPISAPSRKGGDAATADVTVDALAAEAAAMTDDQRAAVLEALRFLSARDSDHAQFENQIGFNGRDTIIGHSLAERSSLTAKQAALGRRIVRKYRHTQLPEAIVERIGFPEKKGGAS